ncbi:MAG: methionine biosynthesis protein MetW [Vicinamibacterales bacterium]|nr:methionine biosynthesis protein MetW [Vicinamibacterales bacterium]
MSRPLPIPPPDRHQIEALNQGYELGIDTLGTPGWRGRLVGPFRRLLMRVLGLPLQRQQTFNSLVVDHLNRMDARLQQAHDMDDEALLWAESEFEQVIRRVRDMELTTDGVARYREAIFAREQRAAEAVERLAAAQSSAHEEVRHAIGLLQIATQSLARDLARVGSAPQPAPASGPAPSGQAAQVAPTSAVLSRDGGYKYVGFEERFRGSQEDIRQRQLDYVSLFAGAADVLDVGCGRGEFLSLLKESGVTARGIDVNQTMVDVCTDKGLTASAGDALAYLRAQPDESLGGLIAAQVIEHFEPAYINAFVEVAFTKLRPGAPIVLETINPACWYAFFSSYIRDYTHKQPVHPDTLSFLMGAAGFERVELRYLSPVAESEKLQHLTTPPGLPLSDVVEALNLNVDRLNTLLFSFQDYAAVGRRP